MILARGMTISVSLCLAAFAAQARADVMEIDTDGARWIAGPNVSLPANETVVEVNDVTVPMAAVANTARHSAVIPAEYSAKIHELAARFDLSPALLEAVVWQESRWRKDAVSPAGARGLAQLMPDTAKYLGVNADDPFANLEGGARYLREQLDRFDGDLEKALAAYNAGPGRVIRANGVPNIRETKGYVAAVMGRLASHSRPDTN